MTKPEPLDKDTCIKLLQESSKAKQNTFPERGKGEAVALLTKAGNIYTGASYSSDTETLTMHSVAIEGPNCHICKQLIYESSLRSGINTLIIIEEEDGEIKQIPISEMMIYPWPDKPRV